MIFGLVLFVCWVSVGGVFGVFGGGVGLPFGFFGCRGAAAAGPAAPPLYPAAYAGVVGVTAVGAARRVLPEAAQGPQVMWSAPGADMAVARSGGGYGIARGTSFAAPLVAGLLATGLREPDPGAAAAS